MTSSVLSSYDGQYAESWKCSHTSVYCVYLRKLCPVSLVCSEKAWLGHCFDICKHCPKVLVVHYTPQLCHQKIYALQISCPSVGFTSSHPLSRVGSGDVRVCVQSVDNRRPSCREDLHGGQVLL